MDEKKKEVYAIAKPKNKVSVNNLIFEKDKIYEFKQIRSVEIYETSKVQTDMGLLDKTEKREILYEVDWDGTNILISTNCFRIYSVEEDMKDEFYRDVAPFIL